jgi:hypothetical protein
MSDCYAFTHPEWHGAGNGRSPIICQGCGWPYWNHSHRQLKQGGRIRHVLISVVDAKLSYTLTYRGLEGWAPLLPPVDSRSRFQMMLERSPKVCDFVARIMAKENLKVLREDWIQS